MNFVHTNNTQTKDFLLKLCLESGSGCGASLIVGGVLGWVGWWMWVGECWVGGVGLFHSDLDI